MTTSIVSQKAEGVEPIIEKGKIVLIKEKGDFAIEVLFDVPECQRTYREKLPNIPLVTPDSDLGRILDGKTAANPGKKYHYMMDDGNGTHSWVRILGIRD